MKKSWAFTLLCVMSCVSASCGLLSLVPLALSPLVFSEPGSDQNPATVALFLSVATFPLVCLLATAVAWLLYRDYRYTAASVVALLPVVNLLAAAVAVVCLLTVFGGRFGS